MEDAMMHARARKTADEILRKHGISAESTASERYYTVCPKCSSKRKKAHQESKCLGVTIDDEGVKWFCNHCKEGGGEKFEQGKSDSSGLGPIKAIYDYCDESGALLFQALRFEPIGQPKQFRQRTGPDQDKWSIRGVRIVPFMLPELLEDIASEHTIFIVEGEKDVLTLRKHNVPATCNPMGAAKWRPEFNEIFRGADVVICGDNDKPGRDHAALVAGNLHGIASRVRLLDLKEFWPEIKEGGDVSDWFDAGHTREQFDELVERAPDWVPKDNGQAKESRKKTTSKAKHAGLEDAVALRFAELHAAEFRYVALWARWMKYDGAVWRPENTLRTFDEARKLCREAGDAKARTVAAVVSLARADRAIAATIDQWNIDPDLFNAVSTTIDLRTGIARAPDRLDYITKTAAVAPAPPGTPHPLWTAFLKRVTADNTEMIGFLQRYVGYCLTGCTHEHVLMFLFGTGANGKGVFVNTISKLLGDYAIVSPMEMFLASKHDRHPTEIAKLQGARLVTAQETEKGRRWDEAKIKNLTSDDQLSGRFMRQDFFDFTPTHKLIIAGNHKPSLSSVDEAINRRLLLVPFAVQIPKRERDKHLARKLEAEWPAILRWAIDGCLKWKRSGLMVPATVLRATEDYLADQDAIGQWLDECATRDARAFITTSKLFESWKSWCAQSNQFIGSKKEFSAALADRDFEHVRKEYGRGFKGLMLKPKDDTLL